jgi:serine/threonine-protein kinase
MAEPPDPKEATRSSLAADAATDGGGSRRIGKYEIKKKIGAGGMGAVFLAIDSALKRSVALKVLPHEKAANPTLVKRFNSEAQSAANLRHENIVMIYEAGEADGLLYIALEYVDGKDVAHLVQKRGTIPIKRSIDIVRQMGLALQHAYKQGIVHRDIKPGNILIRRDGMAKLADLGLARAVDENADTSITRAGTTVGTVDYMSPEQARNSKAADVRSDLYSLGCTWYFMLTGEPPFPDGSMTNKLRAHAETPIPDPRTINPAVSEAIVAVLRRMTEKDPGRRYQTPDELLSDLETASAAGASITEAILGKLDDEDDPPDEAPEPARPRAVPARAVPARELAPQAPPARRGRRHAGVAEEESSAPGWKPPRDGDDEDETSEASRAIPFYLIVVLIVGGALAGVAWLVQQFSSTVAPPIHDVGGNPFTHAAPREGETADPPAQVISGEGPAAADPASSGQPPRNEGQIYQGEASARTTTSLGGQSPKAVVGSPRPDPAKPPGESQTNPANPPAETGLAGTNSAGAAESADSAAVAAFRAHRPRLPPVSAVSAENSEPIRVDLSREDLGRFLAGRKLHNGTQIVASGFGSRQSSPIVVENVWIRLTFEQTEGPPLVLSPKSAGSTRQEAFITVRNGGLEVAGGAFNVSMAEKSGARSFLRAIDSDLAMRNCRVLGPASSGSRGQSLFEWQRAEGQPPERMFAGAFEGYAAFESCFVIGSGTILKADMSRRALFVRNSVLISRDDLLAVDLRSPVSQVGGAIDLETATLSAAGSFFRITPAAVDLPTDQPFTVFADRCVFGPPLRSGKAPVQPALVSSSDALIETRQLDWWENHCGYAPDLGCFLRTNDAPAEPQDFERQWQSRWDRAQVIQPLTGSHGVVLNQDLPQRPEDRLKVEPADFALYPASQASTWDGGTGPIGAPIASLRVPPLYATGNPAPARPPAPRGKPAKSRTTNPPKPGF